MKKRIVALCLAALMLFGMLSMTGCQRGGGNAQPNFVVPEGGFDTTQEVTIGQGFQAALNQEVNATFQQVWVEEGQADQDSSKFCFPG